MTAVAGVAVAAAGLWAEEVEEAGAEAEASFGSPSKTNNLVSELCLAAVLPRLPVSDVCMLAFLT
jgi:hypothetical protein